MQSPFYNIARNLEEQTIHSQAERIGSLKYAQFKTAFYF